MKVELRYVNNGGRSTFETTQHATREYTRMDQKCGFIEFNKVFKNV